MGVKLRMKLNKKVTMSFIIYILALVIIGLLIKGVYAWHTYKNVYFMTDDEFYYWPINDLLGKKLYDNLNDTTTVWGTMFQRGQLACFWHNESSKKEGLNNQIHSVFDIWFDNDRGCLILKSVINDGAGTSKTTYADESSLVGKFAAEVSQDHNAYYVQHTLYDIIKAGIVVNERAIGNQLVWSPSAKYPNLKNQAPADKIAKYSNFRKLVKQNTSNTQETGSEVSINGKSYTIMGPFKMKFGGEGIESVTASNATWTNGNRDQIYWSTSGSTSSGDWKNDFNEATSGAFTLNERNFYLAVETSKLVGDGNYEVKIKQNTFTYYSSRTVVCTGNRLQQVGAYFYGKTPNTVNAEISWTLKRKSLVNLKIVKKDATNSMSLSGAKFKIYGVLKNGTKGWVSGDANGDKTYGTNAWEYADSTNITKLKQGTYYIYETKAPEGYDITKQSGYHQSAEGSGSLSGDWAYIGSQAMNSYKPNGGVYEVTAYNKKVVNGIEGTVWVDEPDTKQNATDNVYKESTNDFLKEGITVNLYDGNNTLLATTTTDASGKYKFTTKNAQSYTNADKNIYYWDLTSAYVEFVYNNKTTYNEDGTVKDHGYVTVDPFVGTDAKVNSKAQEFTITTEKLNDNNLTGTEGANPGKAVTKRGATQLENSALVSKNKEIINKINNGTASETDLKDIPLACYYDNSNYKVSNINLGLLEQYDPDYSVDENLAYVKVRMKGYTYTYKYGDAPATTSTNVPTINEQNSAKTFTGKIYPTDIAYNVANETDELQVYVVYSIDVKNLETMNVDNIYSERKLYLDSLVNTYDTNRYELCNNENNSDKSDFALWSNDGDGKASYDLANENSVYKNGMNQQETTRSYIQFKIKQDALKKILEKGLNAEDIENAPSVATTSGYHEFLRTDNAWTHSNDVRAFNGAKGTSEYPTVNGSQKKYYVHRSINKSRSSADLYLKLSLGDPRKVSGTVFEDTKTAESENNNTSLGNGILDEGEANRAQDVTVELLDADRTTVTKLYKENDGRIVYNPDGSLPDAKVTTQVGGTYEFVGVVPGYYYVRFTYGDGTQKMMPAGSAIKSNDYKSTIINTEENGAGSTIKNAMEAKAEELNAVRETIPTNQTEAQKRLVEWYKYLNSNNYSAAVDDLAQRQLIEKYQYKDNGKVYDESGNEVTNYPTNISAYTPMASISIENDINTSTDDGDSHKSNYDRFNFGIIEQPKTEILLDKKITNIKFTTQTGTTLVSANPTDKSAEYITALDKITGGSKYAKMEMDQNMIYGSELATTYEIVVSNESNKDYIEDEGSDEFGKYYYYGEISSTAKLKKVTVQEIVDQLDKKYNFDSKQESSTAEVKYSDGGTEQTSIAISKYNPDGTTETSNSIRMTGWKSFEAGSTETMSYTVTSLLSAETDTAYENKARITTITIDKLSTLKSDFSWERAQDSTTLTITPPTGSDKSLTYWIAGTIGLIVIAGGIIFLKKKVLKK